jgi:hypothetical protein
MKVLLFDEGLVSLVFGAFNPSIVPAKSTAAGRIKPSTIV